jgi:[acyl-carrier-protein] S-malonyltransferase
MQEAGEASGRGGMLAVLGDGDAAGLAARHGVTIANDNAPGQVVLSGDREALGRLAAEARPAGLKKLRLGVAGAFHSPHMAPAVEAFARAIDGVAFHPPTTAVYSSVTAALLDDPRRRLVEGLTAPVRWRETVLALRAVGVERFVETGPGDVLTRLVDRTLGLGAHA